jgi:hypothetical protein
MAVAKKNNYIELDLEWLETKAKEMKKYVDDRPLDKIVDRMAWKELRGGGRMPVCVATIELQVKGLRETLADYLKLIEAIGKLRETEETKKKANVRGDQELSPLEDGIF